MNQSTTKESFNAAFSKLEKNAQMLRENSAPDIDRLVEVVTESVDAYRVVNSRLDAIDESLRLVFDNLEDGNHK